jgi:hypothetical protein
MTDDPTSAAGAAHPVVAAGRPARDRRGAISTGRRASSTDRRAISTGRRASSTGGPAIGAHPARPGRDAASMSRGCRSGSIRAAWQR